LEFVVDDTIALDDDQIKQVQSSISNAYRAMDDDFNTAQAIGHIFNLLKKINSVYTGQLNVAVFGKEVFDQMIQTYVVFIENILGLKEEVTNNQQGLLDVLLKLYTEAKTARNYTKVDEIRQGLKGLGIVVKDMKDKIDWAYEE
jgi:cysteinyl-tRNA synthetase